MKIALKKLTASDLSLFRPHFNPRGSKQKGINLNIDVFIDALFPALRDLRTQIGFPILVLGPGIAPPLPLCRKVVRTAGGKNWRLNGEIINNPDDDDSRFDCLRPGDFAVLGFDGATQPENLKLLLVSRAREPHIHEALVHVSPLEGRASMRTLDTEAIRAVMQRSQSGHEGLHPLRVFLAEESVIGALYGDQTAETVTSTSGRGHVLEPGDLAAQMEAARHTGERGEELFMQFLAREAVAGAEWVSRTHARASYDFIVDECPWPDTGRRYVDVKASTATTTRHFYASLAELRWAAGHAYRIARITGVDSQAVSVVILSGLSELARETLNALSGLPTSVVPQTFRIEVDALKVLAEYTLDPSVEPDGAE